MSDFESAVTEVTRLLPSGWIVQTGIDRNDYKGEQYILYAAIRRPAKKTLWDMMWDRQPYTTVRRADAVYMGLPDDQKVVDHEMSKLVWEAYTTYHSDKSSEERYQEAKQRFTGVHRKSRF